MKKYLVFFFIFVTVSFLGACTTVTSDFDKVFKEDLITYASGDNSNSVTQNVTLKTKSDKVAIAKISWESSNSAVIKIDGDKGIVSRLTTDTTITLTATVTINKESKKQDFSLKVIKKVEETSTEQKDEVKPVITGAKNWTLTVGDSEPNWLEGVTANDDRDGEISVIVSEKNVDLTKAGTYKVVYKAVDKSSNETTVEVEVIVNNPTILDTTPPEIHGTKDWELFVGDDEPNWLADVTATDEVDGPVNVTIIEKTVDLSNSGTYKIVYQAIDLSGNKENVEIKVIVLEPTVDEEEYIVDFNDISGSTSSYTNHNYEHNGINWIITGARTDQALTGDNGKAIAFGGAKDKSKISAEINGGISEFSVDTQLVFGLSQERKLELFINGESKGVFTLNLSDSSIQTFSVKDINIKGTFTLELRHISGVSDRAQVIIDNLKWKTYSGVAIPVEKQNLDKDVSELSIITQFMESGIITLPEKGVHGSNITWSYKDNGDVNNQYINLNTKTVTIPNSGRVTVGIIANLTNGDYETTKNFNIVIGETDPISIITVRSASNGTKVKTIGTITDFYSTNEGIYFFMQDNTAGIYGFASNNFESSIKIGNEISLIGTKTTTYNQVEITDITNLTILGTKTITPVVVTKPMELSSNVGKMVKLNGILKQSYSELATRFELVNKYGSFELVIPNNLVNKNSIQTLLGKNEAGLEVNITGGVYQLNSNYQILLINPSNIDVKTTINKELVKEVVSNHLDLPTYDTKVSSDIDLPTIFDIISGIRVEWHSTNKVVIADDGSVTQQDSDTTVRINYDVLFNNEILYTGFIDVTVAAISNYEGYYASLEGLTGSALKAELNRIISKYKNYSYSNTSPYIAKADEDLPGKVLTIYDRKHLDSTWDGGNTWNKEHVWPKSKIPSAAESDMHNLRASTPTVNSNRGSLPFVDGSGSYLKSGGWYPGDDCKGDVARIIFYMSIRWNIQISSGSIGSLQMFIEWHLEDPVDDFERHRNDVIYTYQENRNPFIDHPELVGDIFGNTTYNINVTYESTITDMINYNYELIKETDITILTRKFVA